MDKLRQAVTVHFENPPLAIWKTQGGFSVYGAVVQSQLLAEAKVVFVIVDTRLQTKTKSLAQLPWINLQTRTVPNASVQTLPTFSYLGRGKGLRELEDPCTLTRETEHYMEYAHPTHAFSFRISKTGSLQWGVGARQLSLRHALETYSCELRLSNQH